MKRFLVYTSFALFFACACSAQTFKIQSRPFRVGPNPCAIAAGDLTGDGLPDLVTADRGELSDIMDERPANDELSLLIAQEDGEFIRRTPSLKVGFGPYAVALANIDALKWLDIITVNFHAVKNRDISLFLNLRQEDLFKPFVFEITDEPLPYTHRLDGDGHPLYTTPGLTSLRISDLNGDGIRDLCATAWSSDAIVYLPGDKELNFGTPVTFPVAGSPRDLDFTDFNGDGNTDIVTALYTTGQLALLEGDGEGAFTEFTRFLTRGRLPIRVRVADLNGDGIQDLTVIHRGPDDSIVCFLGDEEGRFPISEEIMLGTDRRVPEHELRDLVVQDLDDNGLPDIAVTCHVSNQVVVFLNKSADGKLTWNRKEYTFKEGRPYALCAEDFNADGKTDLAVTLWEENAVAILLQQD